MDTFSSSGPPCESPYSDVTSASPSQVCLDLFQPISPGFISMDGLRTGQLSVQSATSDSAADDSELQEESSSSKAALEEFLFYQSLVVGSSDAVQAHAHHLNIKHQTGSLGLPVRTPSTSLTPYSDVAQPKKPGKEGVVKRPMNAFMVFAQAERGHLMAGQPDLHNARISKHLGDVWRLCPTTVKEPYIAHANWLKELHRQEHPDYKYRPRKRKAAGESPIVTDTTPSSSSSSSSITGEDQKPAAKKPRKPSKTRNGARKPTGQSAHVVPASTLSLDTPPPADTELLYPEVPEDLTYPAILDGAGAEPELGDGTQFIPDLPDQIVFELRDVPVELAYPAILDGTQFIPDLPDQHVDNTDGSSRPYPAILDGAGAEPELGDDSQFIPDLPDQHVDNTDGSGRLYPAILDGAGAEPELGDDAQFIPDLPDQHVDNTDGSSRPYPAILDGAGAEPELGDDSQFIPDLLGQNPAFEPRDVAVPQAVDPDGSNGEVLLADPVLPTMGLEVITFDDSDDFGFNTSAENLVQGSQVHDILDSYEGELPDMSSFQTH
ncbi:uncharacterized protein LOC143279701 [Babylonia areolata]|uniref:uncharacterized protein LOC143279701 n=1 Tax=Babylonia areolata TaxID=304850 RepID=UPI003FD1A908